MLIGSECLDVWEWLTPTQMLSYFSFHLVVLSVRSWQSCHIEILAKD